MADKTDNGPALISMAQQFSGLPMPSLIGGPLMAALKANTQMSVNQTKSILDTCFTTTASEANSLTYTPIMITLSLERPVITPPESPGDAPIITPITTKFQLPLLTIMPINTLAVQSVKVGFEMEVKSSFSQDDKKETASETKGEAGFTAKMNWGLFSVEVHGSVSYSQKDSETHSTHYEKSNSAKYTVSVEAGQLPLPQGINTIIEAFTKSIQPIEIPMVSKGSGALNAGAQKE